MASGDELRGLMRRFPSGVSVVTAEAKGEQLGLTVGSLVSLSLEPPLVGISISRQAALHELLRRARAFAVSLLSGRQEGLAQHFARSGIPPLAMWRGIDVRSAASGAPLLEGALGWIECRVWAEYDASTHTLFVGEVLSLEEGDVGRPLVYLEHGYLAP